MCVREKERQKERRERERESERTKKRKREGQESQMLFGAKLVCGVCKFSSSFVGDN